MFMLRKTHKKWVEYAKGLTTEAHRKATEYGSVIEGMSHEIVHISNERDMAKADLLAIAAERDGLIDTLRDVQIILSKVPEYDGMGAIPVVEGVRQLVADHSELEARIEAVLTHETYAGRDVPNWEAHYVPSDEVHRLLRGGQRVPDTIEGIEG
jgi:hypothetical protein